MSEFNSTVEYRDIQGFPGYRVGSDGTVWTCWQRINLSCSRGTAMVLGKQWKLMKKRLGKTRHCRNHHISLRRVQNGPNIVKQFFVSRLVLEAFVGPCPPGMEACHGSRGRDDDCLDNVRWDTHLANMADRKRDGMYQIGENHYAAKLTEKEVREIARRADSGEAHSALAKEFHSSRPVVWAIHKRRIWRHLFADGCDPKPAH